MQFIWLWFPRHQCVCVCLMCAVLLVDSVSDWIRIFDTRIESTLKQNSHQKPTKINHWNQMSIKCPNRLIYSIIGRMCACFVTERHFHCHWSVCHINHSILVFRFFYSLKPITEFTADMSHTLFHWTLSDKNTMKIQCQLIYDTMIFGETDC